MKIFLSSTCYQSGDLRAVLERYIHDLGHVALLSDRLNFPIDPRKHRHDVCLEIASQSDLMLLVIEPRFGAEYYKDNSVSVTWAEFRAAINAGVRVLAFIRKSIFDERQTWRLNDRKLTPAHCDDTRIFTLIDEVQAHPSGIWVITSFEDVTQILTRLETLGGFETFAKMESSSERIDIVSGGLSAETMDYLRVFTKKHEELQFALGEIKDARDTLQFRGSGYQGIRQYSDMQADDSTGLVLHTPLRPAEDDGSSWYCVASLTPMGQRVLNELTEYIRIHST